MVFVLIIITIALIIGLAGIIGNQYSGLKKMNELQRSLDDINQKLRNMNDNKLSIDQLLN
jgi:uncharacterized membrane protein (DUF106 family)